MPYIERKEIFLSDYKSALQEMVQTDKESLSYEIVREEGPAHDKTFEVNVVIDGIVLEQALAKAKKKPNKKQLVMLTGKGLDKDEVKKYSSIWF